MPDAFTRYLIAADRRGTQCTTENAAELWDMGSNWDRDARRRIYGMGGINLHTKRTLVLARATTS